MSSIISIPSPDEDDAILWHCPVCHDNGVIRGWQGTLWDGSREIHSAS